MHVRALLPAALALLLAAAGCSPVAEHDAAAPAAPPLAPSALPGAPILQQLLVLADEGVDLQAFAGEQGLTLVSLYPGSGLGLLVGEADPALLAGDPRIVAAQGDGVVGLAEPQSLVLGFHEGELDPDRPFDQRALRGLRLAEAHQDSRGAGVLVAVLDTGVDAEHPHLAARLDLRPAPFLGEPLEQAAGVDSDGDGQLDEAFGHGTHMAGLVATVAPAASILPVRVLDSDGVGTSWQVAVGLQWALLAGADVVNLSLSLSEDSSVVDALLQRMEAAGIAVVAAAGNAGGESAWPARSDRVAGVVALDDTGHVAAFSNRGGVQLGAPGTGIASSYPGGGWATGDGSSMSTAIVSGCLALLRASRPDAPQRLYSTADPIQPADAVEHGAVDPVEALATARGSRTLELHEGN